MTLKYFNLFVFVIPFSVYDPKKDKFYSYSLGDTAVILSSASV